MAVASGRRGRTEHEPTDRKKGKTGRQPNAAERGDSKGVTSITSWTDGATQQTKAMAETFHSHVYHDGANI